MLSNTLLASIFAILESLFILSRIKIENQILIATQAFEKKILGIKADLIRVQSLIKIQLNKV